MGSGSAQRLFGREAEQGACGDALDAAASGSGGVLLISGEAGIGKTALLREVQAAAVVRGLTLLAATAAPTESTFPFGVARQLLLDVAGGLGDVLEGVTPTAAAVLGLSAQAPAVPELASALQGLYRLVSNFAQRRPVVIVIDDAQWADLSTLAFVEHLARGVSEMPCLVVLGVRSPDLGNDAQHAALTRLGRDVRHVPLTALGLEAAGALVRERFASATSSDVLRRCHEATGGNPFLLHALATDVLRRGGAASDVVGLVEEATPAAVVREVLHRLSRLDSEARALAKAVAVLGAVVQVRDAAAVAGLQVQAAELAADRLADAGVLAASRPLAYLHPLLRQAAYADVRAGERALLHRAAASCLQRYGAPAGHAAAHLLQASPAGDPEAVTLLRAAAAEALRTGLPDEAVRFLERAVSEPPVREDRPAVLAELGHAQARAALPRAVDTLAAAFEAGVDAGTRATIALEFARASWYLRGDAQAALRVLDAVGTEDLDADCALRVRSQRVELRIGWVDGLGGLGPAAREHGLRELDELAPHAHPPRPASAVLLGSLARRELERGGSATEAARLACDAVAAGEESLLYSSGPDVLVWSEHDAEAEQVLGDLVESGRRSGLPYPFAVGSLWRGVLAHRTGRVRDAEADCRTCVDIMHGLGVEGVTFPLGFLVDVVAERDLAAAEELVQAAQGETFSEFFLYARGRLRAQQGRLGEAVEDLRAAQPWHSSPAVLPWRSSLALVLARVGEADEAQRLAREEVTAAQAQHTPRATGVALRALGTVLGGEEGLDLLGRAVSMLGASGAPLERARALGELGTLLRRLRRPVDAREPLREALDGAHRCGADVLAVRLREELLAVGARPRRRATTGRDALTAGELRVARLAADGRSNQDIAHELFVSPWTVASHLTRVYGKLGVSGREQLPGALKQPT